jgi:hypothetical protein
MMWLRLAINIITPHNQGNPERIGTMTITTQRTAAPRTLITPELFGKLTRRVMTDEDTDRPTAEAITEQALAFLATCARHPEGSGLSPSRAVDAGWHAFILHTREYATFCHSTAGRFIHHHPTGPDDPPTTPDAITATMTAMQHAGYTVDPVLWATSADCSQCHQGCHDSPKGA